MVLSNKNVQTTPDYNAILRYDSQGTERYVPLDTKITLFPEEHIKLFNGSLNITHNYDIPHHIQRVMGALNIYHISQDATIKILLEKLTLSLKSKNFIGMQQILYTILCNQKNMTIFLSLILESNVNTDVVLSDDDIKELNHCFTNDEVILHIARLFPEMGKENIKNFRYEIQGFMEMLPKQQKVVLMENYTTFLDLITKHAQILS